MTKRRASDALHDSADEDQVDHPGDHKRQRLDSATCHTSPQPHRPKVDAVERAKTGSWLQKKADSDAILFPVTYYKPTPKQSRLKRRLAGKWKHQVLNLSGRDYGTVTYAVGNLSHWNNMYAYKRCTVQDTTFETGECVRVRGDSEKNGGDKAEGETNKEETEAQEDDQTLSQWKAQIREIRAFDENNVFVRVAWLYRPAHDIPDGPRPYHGRYELVPSTELSIIDAKTIDGRLRVKYWDEWKDDEVHEEQQYFWRQSYDHVEKRSTECRSMCRCSEPQNPDHPIVQCPGCKEWQHSKCLEAEAVKQYLEHCQGTLPNDGSPAAVARKKPARTKASPSPGQAEGVTAMMHEVEDTDADGDGGGEVKLSVKITDLRASAPWIEERPLSCLLCCKPIDS